MTHRPIDQIGIYRLGTHRDGYVVRWQDSEQERSSRLGISTAEPKAIAKGAFALWVRQREASLAQQERYTIGQLMAMYLDSRRIEGKPSHARMVHNWKALATVFDCLQPADVAAPFLVRGEVRTRCHYYAAMRHEQGRARDTILTELTTLRTALNWAATRGLIGKAPHVWVNKAGKARDTHLSEDEVLRLLDGSQTGHIRLLFLVALFTGARRGAICDLQWPQVNFERNTIDFRIEELETDILDSSHSKGRAYVDMHPALRIALAEAKETAQSNYVIEWRGARITSPAKAIREAVKNAGLSGRYIGAHALRHTIATWAADKGVDMRKIQKMLGHADVRTTEICYARHTRGFTLAVADSVKIETRRIG